MLPEEPLWPFCAVVERQLGQLPEVYMLPGQVWLHCIKIPLYCLFAASTYQSAYGGPAPAEGIAAEAPGLDSSAYTPGNNAPRSSGGE